MTPATRSPRWICDDCYWIWEHDSEPAVQIGEDGKKILYHPYCPRCDEHSVTGFSFPLEEKLKSIAWSELEESLAHWKKEGREDRVAVVEKAIQEKHKLGG